MTVDYLCFKNAPLPPSDNQLYRNVPRIGRVKTAEYRTYCRLFDQWAWTQRHNLNKLKTLGLSATDPLALQLVFTLTQSKVFTKAGTLKRFDVQNRGKAFIDLLSKFIGIDDSQFFTVFFVKTVGVEDSVTAILSQTPPGILTQVDHA